MNAKVGTLLAIRKASAMWRALGKAGRGPCFPKAMGNTNNTGALAQKGAPLP